MHSSDTIHDLYIAPSSRPLLFSFAAALLENHPAEIVYMNDYAPLPAAVETLLRRNFPQIGFSIRTDRGSADEFATLPSWAPTVLRRNIAPQWRKWLAGPADRPPDWLQARYRNAYIYVTGPFITKTLRGRCDQIILREDGLGNYHPRRVNWGKAILRALYGLPSRYHFMGEEDWVDVIEVARTKDLPLSVQHKARRLQLTDLLDALPADTRHRLAASFWAAPPFELSRPGALVLKQPLASLGITTEKEANNIYDGIASRLRQSGYDVYTKPHPQEIAAAKQNAHEIPPFFPIEAWPYLWSCRFSVAVAICSAALDAVKTGFSDEHIQLVRPEAFGRGDLSGWEMSLDSRLAKKGAIPAGGRIVS